MYRALENNLTHRTLESAVCYNQTAETAGSIKTNKGAIASMQARIPDCSSDIIGKPARQSDAELDIGIREWSGIQPGEFWAQREAMPAILQEMIAARRVPRVRMKNLLEYRQFELRDTKEPTVVRALPSMWEDLLDFKANLSFVSGRASAPYNGEGIAAYSLKALIMLMKPQRSQLPQMEGCCTVCGSYALLERDHRIPVSLGGSGDQDNIQMLCSACHLAKTRQEQHSHAHY